MKKFGLIAAAFLLVAFVGTLMVLDEPSAAYAQGGKTNTPRPTGITRTPGTPTPTVNSSASSPINIPGVQQEPGKLPVQIPGFGDTNFNPGQLGQLGQLSGQLLPGLLGVAFDPMKMVRETVWTWWIYQFWAGLVLGILITMTRGNFQPNISPGWIFAAAFGPGVVFGIAVGFGTIAIAGQVLSRR